MEISTAFPAFIEGPLYQKVYRARASGSTAGGSRLFVALCKAHYDGGGATSLTFDYPPHQYRYAPDVESDSDIFQCFLPFSGVATTSGGTAGTNTTYELPFTGTFEGQQAGVSAAGSTAAVVIRVYDGGGYTTVQEISGAARCRTQTGTDVYSAPYNYSTINFDPNADTNIGGYMGAGEYVLLTAKHIPMAKLNGLATKAITVPYELYFGFMPNDIESSAPDATRGFVSNLAITSWAPAQAIGYNVPNPTKIFYAPGGTTAFPTSNNGLFYGFLKGTAFGKRVSAIADDEIVLGGRILGTSFQFLVNGAVVYDIATDTPVVPFNTGTTTYAGFGFSVGETISVGATFSADGADLVVAPSGSGVTQYPFRNGDAVVFQTNSSTLPTNIVAGTTYYLKNHTQNTHFRLATSPGGANIAHVTSGSGDNRVRVAVPEGGVTPDITTADPSDFNAPYSVQVALAFLNGGSSTIFTVQRMLRAEVNFTDCCYAVVNDQTCSGSGYINAGFSDDYTSPQMDTMFGVSYDVLGGFWQDETNCEEDIYGGQI